MAQGYGSYRDFLEEQIKRLDNLIKIDPKNKESYNSEKIRLRKEINLLVFDVEEKKQNKELLSEELNSSSKKEQEQNLPNEEDLNGENKDEENDTELVTEEIKEKMKMLLDKKTKQKLLMLCELISLPAKEVKENSKTKEDLIEYMSSRVKEEDLILI